MDAGLLQGIAGGFEGAAQGMESALERKRQSRKDALERATQQAGIMKSGYRAVENPETGEFELVKEPGFKDSDSELKDLKIQKLRKEIGAPSKGQEAADTAFGKEYADYALAGGAASSQKHKSAVEEGIGELKDTDAASGPAIGLLPKWARRIVTPGGSALEDKIKGAVQASLKQTLGSQFTAQEGEAVMNRAFDPRLPEEENIKKAEAILKEIEDMGKSKMAASKYFEKTGSTRGFKATPAIEQMAKNDKNKKPPGLMESGLIGNERSVAAPMKKASELQIGETIQKAGRTWKKTKDGMVPLD